MIPMQRDYTIKTKYYNVIIHCYNIIYSGSSQIGEINKGNQ